jgi:hypothetical protein
LLVPFPLPEKAGVSTPEVAMAVNRGGVVVGVAQTTIDGTPRRRPFRWVNGVATDPLFAFDRTSRSWASDVNDAGDIALQRVLPAEKGQALGTWQALILRGGKLTEIVPLEGYTNTAIRALNVKGDAVGYCWNPKTATVPMVFRNGRTLDANKALIAPSDWTIIYLTDINDAGQAVGIAKRGGEMHAIRLDPGPGTGLAMEDQSLLTDAPTWTTAFAGARPNPSTSAAGTQFAFTLASKARVAIRLTNVQGRLVRTLSGDFEAGPGALPWDGCDDSGARVGSGVLFARFAGAGLSDTRKVVVER